MAPKNALHPIPKPPGSPIVGNMLSFDSSKPLQSLMQMTRELGPIFWLDMMGTPLVIVSGASLVEEICDESRFDKAVRGSLRRIRAAAGDGLFTSDTSEPNWSKAHNILLPTFSHRAMGAYLPLMYDIGAQLCMKWERLNADEDIDVVHDMTALALDTIGICGFDYRFNSFYRRDYHPFIDALTRTLETAMVQRGLPFEKQLLRRRLGQMGDDIGFMSGLVDDIIRERRRGGGDAAQKDLLNFMLAGVDKQTGESLSDENIRYQIITFLIAGHETTSGLMSFTLYFLLNHPEVLARAYEEVDRVLGRDVGVAPTFQQVNQLPYVQQILNESLRLWPTAPAIGLYPYKDEVIGGQYRLKKNTFVTLLTLMLHRDKSAWGPEPEKFDPENFSREREAERPANAFKPWGNGQRACIGRQFAMQEATLVLGMILQRFQLFDHQKYELKIKESLSIKPDGFRMKVKVRPDVTRGSVVPGAALAANQNAAPAAAEAKRPKHGTKATILYGSNLGTTEELARTISQSAELNGFDVTLAELDSHAGRLPTEGAVIIASASYNGAPPDNATRFVKWLNEAQPGAADGVNYLVFGCGNRDWASTFQATPRMMDERLEALGARRLMPRGEADAREDLDGQFQAWFRKLWPQVGAGLGLDIDFSETVKAEPLYQLEIVSGEAANPVVVQASAKPMTMLANRELQSSGSGRSTRHIEVALPQGVSYLPGDHLCVVPVNSADLVARIERRFGFSPDTQIRLKTTGGRHAPFPVDGPLSVKRILSDYVELQAVATRKQIETMAENTRCPKTKPELERLAAEPQEGADVYRTDVFIKRKSVLDLLEQYPACELPFGLYLEMLPLLAPRYYSISSSPRATPGKASITVGIVDAPARSGNGVYKGSCSNHLACQPEGSTIHAAIRETKAGFRLPEDSTQPIVMVGPGTGLAPFRAFLQERALLKAEGKALGPAMLFFGCRHPDQDFIYREELEKFAADGICELFVAFSRLESEKTYVQDLLRRERGKVWKLVEAGAKIFVCGDGSRMEPDVKRELTRLYAEEKDVDALTADAWMEKMVADNRYVLDVWAGG